MAQQLGALSNQSQPNLANNLNGNRVPTGQCANTAHAIFHNQVALPPPTAQAVRPPFRGAALSLIIPYQLHIAAGLTLNA